MQNQLPVTIDFGTLPQTGQGYTPQELTDRLSLNARVFTEQAFALFTVGPTAPTSDIGPWAKNGNTWYYWNSVSGSYVPFIIEQSSLQYYVGSATPDHTVYQFWIQLDGSGSPLAVKTWYSGAWVDVYATTLANYATTAAVAASIAALSATLNPYPAKANTGGTTSIPTTNVATKVQVNSIEYDPDSCYNVATYEYIAPVAGYYHVDADIQCDNVTGTAASMEISIDVYKNAGPGNLGTTTSVASPPGDRWNANISGGIQLAAGDKLSMYVTAQDGVGTGTVGASNGSLSVNLIKAI